MNNKHPKDWDVRQLMNYLMEHNIVPSELVGGLTKERMIELVLKDEIEKE